ncbi:hypothetical protein ACNKHU_16620 [Shigella flexneri]
MSSLNLWLLLPLNCEYCAVDVVPIFGGGVIDVPESSAGALPLTELSRCRWIEVSEQPASHSKTVTKPQCGER